MAAARVWNSSKNFILTWNHGVVKVYVLVECRLIRNFDKIEQISKTAQQSSKVYPKNPVVRGAQYTP